MDGIEGELQALPIVPADRIIRYAEEGNQPLGNPHTPMPLAKAAEALRDFGHDVLRGEDKLSSEWEDGLGNESGIVAIRCGGDAFVLHRWVTRE